MIFLLLDLHDEVAMEEMPGGSTFAQPDVRFAQPDLNLINDASSFKRPDVKEYSIECIMHFEKYLFSEFDFKNDLNLFIT